MVLLEKIKNWPSLSNLVSADAIQVLEMWQLLQKASLNELEHFTYLHPKNFNQRCMWLRYQRQQCIITTKSSNSAPRNRSKQNIWLVGWFLGFCGDRNANWTKDSPYTLVLPRRYWSPGLPFAIYHQSVFWYHIDYH